MRKIIIFGSVGAGKTTFAKRLSKKLKIPFFTTDEMVWNVKTWKRYSRKVCNAKLQEVLGRERWIIEGVHKSDWILPALKEAEIVILLDFEKKILYKNIFRRYKRGRKKKNAYGRVWSFVKLLWWAHGYRSSDYFKMGNDCRSFVVLKNFREGEKFLEEVN